jgi:hypothetical protein
MKLHLALTISFAAVLGAAACRWDVIVIWCYQFKNCRGPAIQGVTIQQCLTGGTRGNGFPIVVFGCYAQFGPNNADLPNGEDNDAMCHCAEKKMEECYENAPDGFDECRYYALKDVDCEKFAAGGDCTEDLDIYNDCLEVNSPRRELDVDDTLPMCFQGGSGPLGAGGSCRCADDAQVELCAT